MSGVYARNKLFDDLHRVGADDLPDLEDDVHVEDSTEITVFEEYELMIEDFWPDFIRDFYD